MSYTYITVSFYDILKYVAENSSLCKSSRVANSNAVPTVFPMTMPGRGVSALCWFFLLCQRWANGMEWSCKSDLSQVYLQCKSLIFYFFIFFPQAQNLPVTEFTAQRAAHAGNDVGGWITRWFRNLNASQSGFLMEKLILEITYRSYL